MCFQTLWMETLRILDRTFLSYFAWTASGFADFFCRLQMPQIFVTSNHHKKMIYKVYLCQLYLEIMHKNTPPSSPEPSTQHLWNLANICGLWVEHQRSVLSIQGGAERINEIMCKLVAVSMPMPVPMPWSESICILQQQADTSDSEFYINFFCDIQNLNSVSWRKILNISIKSIIRFTKI